MIKEIYSIHILQSINYILITMYMLFFLFINPGPYSLGETKIKALSV